MKGLKAHTKMALNLTGELKIYHWILTVQWLGTMSGSGGIVVMDNTVDMVEAMANINAFCTHESCGQCTPCREGSLWMKKITSRMCSEMQRGRCRLALSVANQIEGRTICAFSEVTWPTQSFVKKFRKDFVNKAKTQKRKGLSSTYLNQ